MSDTSELNSDERNVVSTLNLLSRVCHGRACEKGFYDAHNELLRILQGGLSSDVRERMVEEVMVTATLTRHALIDSEIAEATEGRRKDLMSDKIPGFTSQEEEMADALIRIADYCGWLNLRLGEATAAKLAYNEGRPRMHGGKRA